MIVVDIETSGSEYNEHGIWQIGAVDTENPENTFLQEAKIDIEDQTNPDALKITGMTEKKLRDPKKQTQKELIKNFFDWCSKIKNKNYVAFNPQFDIPFLRIKAKKYNIKDPFQTNWRVIDLHTVAYLKYLQINKKYPENNDYSILSLNNIVEFCGLKAERKTHNALEDAKLEAECLSRMLHGKKLIKEYNKFEIPEQFKT